MNIDLYTIIIQFANFIVLLLLLNKFLYKPLLKTINKRQESVEKQIHTTELNLQESEKMKETYSNKLLELDKDKKKHKKEALEEVENFKVEEMSKAQQDIDLEREKLSQALNNEKKRLIEEFNSNFTDLFIEYSNNILSKLSNSSLQNQIVNKFLEKISSLSIDKINELNKNITSGTVLIHSNIDIEEKDKENIKNLLIKKGLKFDNIQYSINTNLVLGIELKVENHIISWNVKEFNEDFILKMDKKLNN